MLAEPFCRKLAVGTDDIDAFIVCRAADVALRILHPGKLVKPAAERKRYLLHDILGVLFRHGIAAAHRPRQLLYRAIERFPCRAVTLSSLRGETVQFFLFHTDPPNTSVHSITY